jgi:hypothetical protein
MGLILLIILILLLVGALPTWGYHSFGYAPSGIGGVVLLAAGFYAGSCWEQSRHEAVKAAPRATAP